MNLCMGEIMRSKYTRAAVAALALSLALAPAAMAATSQTTNDSFTVNAAISITGVPATTSYGSLDGGQTSAVQTIDATIASNVPWRFDVSGTDFARAGGGTLSKHQRQVLLSSTGGDGVAFQVTPGPTAWQAFDDATLTDGTADATGAVTASSNVRAELRVVIPGGTQPGNYSGSVTFTVAEQ